MFDFLIFHHDFTLFFLLHEMDYESKNEINWFLFDGDVILYRTLCFRRLQLSQATAIRFRLAGCTMRRKRRRSLAESCENSTRVSPPVSVPSFSLFKSWSSDMCCCGLNVSAEGCCSLAAVSVSCALSGLMLVVDLADLSSSSAVADAGWLASDCRGTKRDLEAEAEAEGDGDVALWGLVVNVVGE